MNILCNVCCRNQKRKTRRCNLLNQVVSVSVVAERDLNLRRRAKLNDGELRSIGSDHEGIYYVCRKVQN